MTDSMSLIVMNECVREVRAHWAPRQGVVIVDLVRDGYRTSASVHLSPQLATDLAAQLAEALDQMNAAAVEGVSA